MNKFFSRNSLITASVLCFAFSLALPTAVFAAGPAAVNLGTAGNFRILAQTAVTDGNPSITSVVGNVGVSPAAGSTITGLSCTNIAGNVYDVDGTYTGGFDSNVVCFLPGPGANKTIVDNAVLDMGTAYTNASAPATPAGVGPNLNIGGGTVSGENLVPGTYTWGSNVTITGDITLTGSASDVWVFQVTGTLTIGNNVKIILAGGALPSNIFWQVTGAVTLSPGSDFSGNILAQTNIAMQAGATLHGRALAQTAVTLIGNTVTSVGPAPIILPPVATTSVASLLTDTEGTLNGSITSTGGSDATQSGFAYGTDPTLTAVISTSTLGAETGTASFLEAVSGLSANTTYYVRAYATNSAGTGLGPIQSFTTASTTPPAPAPTPTPAPVSAGFSSGGSSPIPSFTTTTVTNHNNVPSLPNTGKVPGLPNTGFPPRESNIPWTVIILTATSAVLIALCVVWKKRSA